MRTLVLLVGCLLVACAGSAWKQAMQEDTASAYHHFLREHPRSGHAQEARERLDFVRLRSNPTQEGYERFGSQHPRSALLAELEPVMEERHFQAARATGTAESYRDFVERFQNGSYRDRAEGNAVFLEAQGFGGRPDELGSFAKEHPASDFAAEAGRSAAAVRARDGESFRTVGLRIEIAPGTPGADRLARVFVERARRQYETAGISIVPLRGADDPRAAELPAVLRIRHSERLVKAELGVRRPGLLAETEVSVTARGDSSPFWSDELEYRTSAAERNEEKSVLFEAGSSRYWEAFFVPIATWNSRAAVRPAQLLEKPAVAVEAAGSRAVVAYGDGDFQIFDLGDPAQPILVGEYRRPRDLAKFGGVRLLGQRAVVFGEDGVEIVDLAAGGPQRSRVLDRSTVGSPIAIEGVGGDLVLAGKRGLILVSGDAAPRTLVDRPVLGMARTGNRLLFTDGASLFVSTVPLLKQGRIEAELKLGRGFAPARVRVAGSTGVVLGDRGIARLDLANPARPQVRSYIMMNEVGAVRDATVAAGRLFLLGDRGLQLADPTGERVVDSADVEARARLGATGRHLVLIEGKTLQVVDATPFVRRSFAAKQGE